VEPVYSVARAALLVPLGHGLRWTFEGAHRVPAYGPAILASNHTSYLDPLVLAYLADRRHRRVRFLAKAELFDKAGLGWGLRQMGQIPVHRNSTEASDRAAGTLRRSEPTQGDDAAASLDAAVAALHDGECVVVFPEGTISLDLEPMAARTGTARLAAASGVPVTPVGLWGAHRIMFKGRKPKWRRGIAEAVVVGDPVPVAPDEDVYDATDRIMAAIAACVARARAVYPQQPRSDEGDWWVRQPETAVARPTVRRTSADS
jgi:1-acyl-sn-glycerol-3-phosphate acyltransferase